MNHDSPDVAAALARLERLHPRRIDLSLERLESLLADLGSPELHLPPVIHIAGTNGKGSTVATLRAILEAGRTAGAGLHFSPSREVQRAHPIAFG